MKFPSIKLNKKTMNKTNIVLSIFAMVLVLTLLPIVSSAVTYAGTMYSPVAGGNYSSTLTFAISAKLVNSTTLQYNATLVCNSSGGTASAFVGADIVKVVTITNKTSSPAGPLVSDLNKTAISLASLTDLMTYNCSGYVDNGTDQEWAFMTTANLITKDATSPVCTVSVPLSNVPNQGSQVVTWSITDALSLVSSNQNITGPTGFTTLTSTNAVSSTEFSLQNLVGSWSSDVLGTDRAGNTCLGTVDFTSYNNDYGSNYIPPVTPGTDFKPILILAGIGAAIYFFIIKKK
ncbi:MAG: hypothetical protein WC758_07755 [Candidatus Woesearchaeota archaeon]|jgi:hypothetical protein